MRVALLGTGTMGAGMARNLLAAGHELRVITMLADGPAVAAGDGDDDFSVTGEAGR
jgi:3-hydroxyisobutyrate dehydrogenase-like beta-hydroxyacid dehydrogenase